MPKAIKTDQFCYMSNESWRILMSVEVGMRNHEFVPPDLVHKISRCSRRSSSFLKLLKDELVPHGLLAYEIDSRKSYSGYRLTNLGYDYLALHSLIKADQLIDLGSMIGAGKEADVYLAVAGSSCGKREVKEKKDETKLIDFNIPDKGDYIVIKFHRLGRTSFRKVKEKREYHQGRRSCSWLYLDRLAAKREYEIMKCLYDHGMPVPCPLACNRNAVVMSLLSNAIPLSKVLPTSLRANGGALADCLYSQAIGIFRRLTESGLVHGDFNEFNLMVQGLTDEGDKRNLPSEIDMVEKPIDLDKVKLILIDFPQMISRDHRTGQEIYQRDLNGILSYFTRYLELDPTSIPSSSVSEIPRTSFLDVDLKAPGFPRSEKSKKKGNHQEVDDSDLLVGTVASFALDEERGSAVDVEGESESEEECNTDDDNEDDNEDFDSDSEENLNVSDDDKSSDSSQESAEELPGQAAAATLSKASKKTTQSVITKDEARERRRREDKKRQQDEFRRRIKRQQRANIKNRGRQEIAFESRLFG